MREVKATLRLPAHVHQHLHASSEQTAHAVADAVAQAAREGIGRRGSASFALSGGHTPERFLQKLGTRPLDWPAVTVTLADDRWVAADDPDSNERLVRENLLQGAAAQARFVPLVDVRDTPERHLASAQRALDTVPRPFDMVVLGVGPDGHTASLFPGAPGTAEAMDVRRPERVALVTPMDAPHLRITLTLRTLLEARAVLVHIEGEDKRQAIRVAVAHGDSARYPIAAILLQHQVPVHVHYNA